MQVSPTCPWCEDGWYEDTDDAKHKPTKKRFRIREPQADMQVEMPTFWKRYKQARRYLERWDIDEDIVHRKALGIAKSWIWADLREYRRQAWRDSSQRKHHKEVRLPVYW